MVTKARVALAQGCGGEIGCPRRLLSYPLYTRPGLKESISGYEEDHLIWLVLVGKSAISIRARTSMSVLQVGQAWPSRSFQRVYYLHAYQVPFFVGVMGSPPRQ